MLKGGQVKSIWELHGEGLSLRAIARRVGVSRNTVRKYVRAPGLPAPSQRAERETLLHGYEDNIRQRLGEGMENCAVLLRELPAQGYAGGRRRTLQAMLDDLQQHLDVLDRRRIFVTHSLADDADWLAEQVQALAEPQELLVTPASCTISSHCGPKTVGILYMTV